jgi:hypothetical protein
MSMLAVQDGPNPHLFYLFVTEPEPGLSIPGSSVIYACGLPEGEWVQNWPAAAAPPNYLSMITCQSGPDPHLFGLDFENNLWAIGLTGANPEWVQNWPSAAPADFNSIAATGGDTPYFFGKDYGGTIYSLDLTTGVWSDSWPGKTSSSWIPETYIAAQNPPSPHLFVYSIIPAFMGNPASYFNSVCDIPSGTWYGGWLGLGELDQLATIATDGSRPLAGLNGGDLQVATFDGSGPVSWTKWAQPGGVFTSLDFITAQGGPDAHIFGIDNDGNLWAIGYPTGSWVQNWPAPLPYVGP